MDGTKLYHILYADDLRLSSLDAQLHGKVPLGLTEDDSLACTSQQQGGAELLNFVNASMGSSSTKSSTQSTEYTFRDARYFSILESLSIDPKNAASTLSVQPDGNIHVFQGQIKAVSSASYSQLSSSAEFQIELEKAALNGKMPGITASAEKSQIQKRLKELQKFQHFFKTGEKRPVVPQFLLALKENKTIYGPLNESFFRLPFIDLVMTFGMSLPFEWVVVGYLYPYSLAPCTEAEDVLEQDMEDMGVFGLAPSFDTQRERFSPKSDAIMIPLLILR